MQLVSHPPANRLIQVEVASWWLRFEGSCGHFCLHILPLTLGATPALSNLSPCCTRLGYLKGSCLRNCWPWLNIICLSLTAASPVALLSETLLEKIFEGLWKDLWGFHESPLGYPHCNPQRSFQWDCEWSLRIFEVPAKLFKDLTRSFKLSQICYRIFKGTWRIYVTVSCGILYRFLNKNSCRVFTGILSTFRIKGTCFSKAFSL